MTRTYRGIVCEKKDKYIIFLTNDGEFLRGIPLGTDPEIGEETEFQLFKVTTPNRKWIKPSVLAPVLVAAVFLIFVVTSFIPNPSTALAYVQLDGDNAVELGINKNGKVVTLHSFNERSRLLLDDWEGRPIDYVLAKVVIQISPTTEKIAVTTVYEKNKQAANLRKLIEIAIEEVQNQQTEKVLQIKESTTKERKEANKNNTSIQNFKHPNKENEDNQIKEHNSNVQPLKEQNEKTTKEEVKQQEELIEKQRDQKEQEIENQQKEIEKKLEKIEKTKEKEVEELQELREKEAEELEKVREKEAEELEKLREQEAKQKEKEQETNEENED